MSIELLQIPSTQIPNLTNLHGSINSLIDQTLGEVELKVTSICQRALKLSGQLFVGAVALGSKFPYIEPNLQLPVSFPLQVTCAVTNFLSWLVFECDNGFKIIDDVLKNPSDDEKALAAQEMHFALKAALGLTCLGLSVISRLPAAFQAMTFNEKKFAIPIAVVVLGAEAIFPTRSLILSAKNFIDFRKTDSEALQKRNNLKNLISENQANFVEKMTTEEKATFIKEIKTIANDITDVGQKRKLYIEKLLSKVTAFPEQLPEEKRTLLNTAATITGLFFAANYEVFNAMYAFTGTKEYLYDNDALAGIISGLVVITTSYLTGKVIIDLTKETFHSIADRFEGKKAKSLANQFYGSTVSGLQVLTFATSLFSLGAYFQIISQYFTNPVTRDYFRVTACIPIFLFLQSSANSFINSQVELWGFTKGSQDKKDIIEMVSTFKNFFKVVDSMDPKNITLFDFVLTGPIRETIGFRPEDIEAENTVALDFQPNTENV